MAGVSCQEAQPPPVSRVTGCEKAGMFSSFQSRCVERDTLRAAEGCHETAGVGVCRQDTSWSRRGGRSFGPTGNSERSPLNRFLPRCVEHDTLRAAEGFHATAGGGDWRQETSWPRRRGGTFVATSHSERTPMKRSETVFRFSENFSDFLRIFQIF